MTCGSTLSKFTRVFVTIEGIEGSGKSTLLRGLAARMEAAGRSVFSTREPGGTPVGDAVRAIFLDSQVEVAPLTEAFLVNAARAQLVRAAIAPRLAAGEVVLCDRFVDSTLAYQGYGRGLDLAMLRRMCAIATAGLLPDCTLVLDISIDLSRQRAAARGNPTDRIESESNAFHARVREGFLALAREPRHALLDASLSADALIEEALAQIARRVPGAVV